MKPPETGKGASGPERTVHERSYRRWIEEQASYRVLVENLPELVCRFLADATLTYVNTAFCRYYGKSREDLVGHEFSSLLPEEYRVAWSEHLASLSRENPVGRFEPFDGETSWLQWINRAVYDDEGDFVEYHGVGRDFNARELAEKALLESEERYRSLADASFEGIAISEAGEILDANRAVCEMFGYELSEVRGMLVPELYAPEYRDEIRQKMSSAYGEAYEAVGLRKDGATFDVEIHGRTVYSGDRALRVAAVRDVTERKRAEERLEESEERFYSLVRNVSDFVVVLDADGAVRYESPAMETVMGYKPEERVGNSALDYVHPDDRERVKESLVRAVENPGVQPPVRFRMRHADGSWRHVETIRNSLLDDPGVRGIVSTSRDVTERVATEARLREAEEKYRGIFDNAVEGIYQTTPDGQLISVNPAVARILGYASPEETIAKLTDVEQLYVEPDRRGRFVDLMRENDRVTEFESRIYRKDGSIAWLSESARAVRDSDGALLYYEGFVEDITERKEAETRLRDSEAELRALFTAMSDVVVVYDAQGRYLKVAPTAHSLLYDSADQLVGRSVHEVLPAEQADEFLECIRRALETRQTVDLEYSMLIDGKETWFAAAASPTSETSVVWVAHDITERKEAEEALKESEDRFRSLVHNAHDIVTILDADGIIRYESPSIERILGYHPEELVGEDAWDYVHPDDQETVSRGFSRTAEAPGENRDPIEFRFLHKDGSWRYLEAVGNNLLDRPSVGGIVANSRDVTERRAAEEALRKSEERFRSLVESIPDIVAVFEADGTIRYDNPALEETLGYGPGERVGGSNFDYVHPDDAERVRESFAKAVESPGNLPPLHFRVRHADGSWRHLESVRTNLLDDPSVKGIVSVARDITERKEAEKALEESEERYRAVIEQSTDGIYIVDSDTKRILETNASLQEMFGYTAEEFRGMELYKLVAHDRDNVDSTVRRTMKEGRRFIGEREYVRKDGMLLDVEVGVNPISYGGKDVICAIVRDVTERKRAEEALKESEERYRAVMEQSAESIWLFDPETKRVLESNESFQKLLGYTAEELEEITNYDFVAHGREDVDATVEDNVRERQRFVGEREYRRKDGSLIDVEVSACVIPYQGKEVVCGVARDVTQRKALEEQLTHQAFYDPLTELPNRALLLDRVGHALAQTDRLKEPIAVLFVDLDDFKVVNDSLGHDAGNALLVGVAERLRACVRPGDTVARLFGDEFAVLLEAPANLEDARLVTERIGERLQEPFVLDGQEAFMSASVGIALSDSAGNRPGDVLRRADLAMYTAKRRRKAQYEVFQPSMDTQAVERLDLENHLRRAIEREEFEVYYQPVVDLRSGEITGLEALVRWRHPERGLVAPGEFIVLAEETGLIRPIGRWVLEESCRQAMEWRERYPDKPLLMSVNLSTSQFSHQPDLISEVLKDTGMDPRNLQLEITERVVMDDAEFSLGKLQKLKGLGVSFAIDDYGTGYSCLYYLKRMPVSLLKIDRMFIIGLGNDRGDEAIVAGTVSLAHALGLKVVAEGVETTDQLAKLEELGCDMVQGFYFAKPLPAEAISSLLKDGLQQK